MKKTFKSIISVAAAAMVFTACNVEPAPVGTEGAHTVSFVVSQDGTKTTMDIKDGVASFDWEEADVNFFYLFENEYYNKAIDVLGDIDEDGAMQLTATFEKGGKAPFTYLGFFAPTFFTYPQVPISQTDNGRYDPKADILIAKPVIADASQSGKALSLQFKRIVSINIMTIKGLAAGETVSEVKIVSDKPIAGKYDYTKDEWYNSTDKQITVSANSVADEKGEAVIYFVSAPVEDAQLTVSVTTTADKTYSKKFAKAITFTEGGVKAFGVTVDRPPVSIDKAISNYTAGTQYAENERHDLGDCFIIYTTDCFFSYDLRIYSSIAHDGYVVSNPFPGTIKELRFNAGYDEDKLIVFGSNDGSHWTAIEGVSVKSTYADYSVDFGDTSYNQFKLDVGGIDKEIRINSIGVTYIPKY